MENPLLNPGVLPTFSNIDPGMIEPTIRQIISDNKQKLAQLLADQETYTWQNLLAPLEEMQDRLSKAWSPISHLHSVMQNEALRHAYNSCQPLLTEYHTELMQNSTLYHAIQKIAKSPEYAVLTDAQRKVIDNDLRDFKLAGVHLSQEEKEKFGELQKELNHLMTQFGENLLDATAQWTFPVTEAALLTGLPEQTLQAAALRAKQQELVGWVLTLDYPCYSSVMKYAAQRELRKTMYTAYVTRASDAGPNAGKWDNTPIMNSIIKIRHQLAVLLGFKNYVDYSLTTKMADSAAQVSNFLNDLLIKSKQFGERDMAELTAFAAKTEGLSSLEAWDVPYYTEKLRQQTYAISQEQLRAYFPIDKVLTGMFAVIERLFGMTVVEDKEVDRWHPHVRFFAVYDKHHALRGYFYTDLYTRENKRDGAWMDEARVRRYRLDGSIQYPVAYLTCNFSQPLGDKPALLTHDDVQTLFHEFGHCLHHIVTQVNYGAVSGINGVPWDAVEFPSQFLEHWCFEKETLALISEHTDTKETLPDALYTKMIAAKNFQAGLHMLRQLEFSLFDLRLHLEFSLDQSKQIQHILDKVREDVAVAKVPLFNRFQHSFSHIFSGGYAAGYYSYKWAEVLSSDAFSRFEEQGVFNRVAGEAYLKNILEQGGVYHPMKLFVAFRGREPDVAALLRHSGLA